MTPDQFRALVRQMRESQKNYFRYRSPEELDRARKYEREVDRALAEHDGGQQRLFGGEQ